MRIGRILITVVGIVVLAGACGGDDDASVATTAPDRSVTTELDGSDARTTTTTTTTTTIATTTTAETTISAPGELVAFVELAESVDTALSATASRINGTFPAPPEGLHDDLVDIAASLDALRAELPGGLDAEVEAAAILVYSDLDARSAALAAMDPLGGMALTDADALQACFANGSPAAQAFADDLTSLRELVADRPSPTSPTDDDLLDVEVRLSTVEALNGDPRCGGFRATAELAVEWADEEGDRRAGRVVLPDGTRLAFDADLFDGRWSVTTHTDDVPEPTTILRLAPFVREVIEVDAALDAVTSVLGDLDAPNVDTASLERFRAGLEAVDFDPVDEAMPDGLPADVEAAAVLVYSDLISRYVAYDNGLCPGMADDELRPATDDVLTTAATADAALDRDLATLDQLAGAAPPTGDAGPGSRSAASLAVRRAFVWLANGGCAQTGGYRAVEPVAVDWLDAPIADEAGRVDGTVETITFTAELDGDDWTILIHAC